MQENLALWGWTKGSIVRSAAVLSEDPSLLPGTQIRRLPRTPAPVSLTLPFRHMRACMCTYTHVKKIINLWRDSSLVSGTYFQKTRFQSPSTHVGWFTTVCNSNFRDSNTSGLQEYLQSHAHTYTCIQACIQHSLKTEICLNSHR